MSIFKIKLKPIVKERGYEVNHVSAGRKVKVCEICKKKIPVGSPSTTFTKRTSIGEKSSYETHHACAMKGTKNDCAHKLAENLKVSLDETYFDWKSVPEPENISKYCRRDPRGLPVPFVVLEDNNGVYHFKVNDSQRTGMCLIGKKCTICGTFMKEDDRWLVGGIASAFDPSGAYVDLPVHKECGQYALQVCPYLAIRNYSGKTDISKLKAKISLAGDIELHDFTVDPDRLPLFVLGRPKSYKYLVSPPDHLSLVPERPFLECEFWDEGKRLTVEDAVERVRGTKWEKYAKSMQDVIQAKV